MSAVALNTCIYSNYYNIFSFLLLRIIFILHNNTFTQNFISKPTDFIILVILSQDSYNNIVQPRFSVASAAKLN